MRVHRKRSIAEELNWNYFLLPYKHIAGRRFNKYTTA